MCYLTLFYFYHSQIDCTSHKKSYFIASSSTTSRSIKLGSSSSSGSARHPVEDDEISDEMSSYTDASSDDDSEMMRGVRRSRTLKKLPAAFFKKLQGELSLNISNTKAKKCLGRKRFKYVRETEPTTPLRISDNSRFVHLFWEKGNLGRDYLLGKRVSSRLKKNSGGLRDQGHHDDCWTFSLSDMVSASLVFHGYEKEYRPLSILYLLQNVDRKQYRATPTLRDGHMHRCYGMDIETGLAYVKRHGIPKQLPGEGVDCSVVRELDENEECFKISKILKYQTLEDALVRLRSRPVAATLITFTGWTDSGIYRGPCKEKGATFEGYHSVLMVNCKEIEGQTVAICKSNSGEDVGFNGYIAVSLGVMLILAGIKRKQENVGSRSFHKKPTHLLTDFYSIDMEYKNHPTTEQAMESKENEKFEVRFLSNDTLIIAY